MFGKSAEIDESSKEVDVLTRGGILEIKEEGLNYTFGEIPDINVDMKSLIQAVIDHDFEMDIINREDKDEFRQVVKDLKSKLGKINVDYGSFDTIVKTLDENNVHGLGDVIKKLYNRTLFFQFDSLLLDYARYVFSYYAVMQLNSVKNIMKKFYSSKSNDAAAKDLSQLQFMSADSNQIENLVGNLDERIQAHKEDLQNKKSTTNATTTPNATTITSPTTPAAPAIQTTPATLAAEATPATPEIQPKPATPPPTLGTDAFVTSPEDIPERRSGGTQRAGSTRSNPIQDLKAKFTERQESFVSQRNQFKEYVNMLLSLLSNNLNVVIEHYKNTLMSVNIDDDLRESLEEIIDKLDPLKDGSYHIKDEASIESDLRGIEQSLVQQLGKRGSIRYTKLYKDIEKISSNIRGIQEVTSN